MSKAWATSGRALSISEKDCMEFYDTLKKPPDLDRVRSELEKFVDVCREHKRNVVLITSGGTTVPIEHNTVRFVDNFSAGTRGSSSAEYFLKQGYAVIFLHRQKSLEPFARHFSGHQILDQLQIVSNNCLQIRSEYTSRVLPILESYQKCQKENTFFKIPFTTLSDYLWFLRVASESLSSMGVDVILYLAAAVADFYIPVNKMPTHKLQSSEGAPTMTLEIVPKMLRPLVGSWVPRAYVASFKLETDESLLITKSRKALQKYQHNLVIANMLQTRKSKVILVEDQSEQTIELSKEELDAEQVEIEERIVEEVIKRHRTFKDKKNGHGS